MSIDPPSVATQTIDAESRRSLFALARQSIELSLLDARLHSMSDVAVPEALTVPRGSFVTLLVENQLRGCCGNLSANRSLAEDVWRNAWASAFTDPRFEPLEAEEWPQVHLHISVLSPLEIVTVADEAELLSALRPNVDGLVLERDDSRATFLPDVWEQISDPADFVRHLKQKAGWPAIGWSPYIKVWRYTTEAFGEQG